MKLQACLAICCRLMLLPALMAATRMSAKGLNGDNKKNDNKSVRSESNPRSMCDATTTYGSTTSVCTGM